MDFTDNLPAGMIVAATSNAATTCTALTAVAGTSVVAYTGGTAPAESTCAISVDVVCEQPGDYVSTSGDPTSDLGNSGAANATLIVYEAIPTLSKTGIIILLVLLGAVAVNRRRQLELSS